MDINFPRSADMLQVCEMIGSTATTTRAMTVMYALGWAQHSVGSQMIRAGAMMQLLLGNIGVSGGGMNALRGHSKTSICPGSRMRMCGRCNGASDGYCLRHHRRVAAS